MDDYKEVTLGSINNGAVTELFNEALGKVLENIADKDTSATAVREITISIKIKPDKRRAGADTRVSVIPKLAPVNPHDSFIVFSRTAEGTKAYTTDPKQNELPLEEEEGDHKTVPFKHGKEA